MACFRALITSSSSSIEASMFSYCCSGTFFSWAEKVCSSSEDSSPLKQSSSSLNTFVCSCTLSCRRTLSLGFSYGVPIMAGVYWTIRGAFFESILLRICSAFECTIVSTCCCDPPMFAESTDFSLFIEVLRLVKSAFSVDLTFFMISRKRVDFSPGKKSKYWPNFPKVF